MTKPTHTNLPAIRNEDQFELCTLVPKRNKRTCCMKVLVIFAMMVLVGIYLVNDTNSGLV